MAWKYFYCNAQSIMAGAAQHYYRLYIYFSDHGAVDVHRESLQCSPSAGPKLMDPKSWKYALPSCKS